jgi:hypothetical protein
MVEARDKPLGGKLVSQLNSQSRAETYFEYPIIGLNIEQGERPMDPLMIRRRTGHDLPRQASPKTSRATELPA